MNIRRALGAFSAVVVAAGFAVTVGAGVADAADDSKKWSDHFSQFTRTISNVNPHSGETITVTTKFQRKAGGAVEYIYNVRDVHPACLTVVSAKVGGKSYGIDSKGDDWAKVKGNIIKWPVYPMFGPELPGFKQSRTFEFTYRVGADCDRNVALDTGMRYTGSLGSGKYSTKGPTIKVALDTSTTDLAAAPSDVQVDKSVSLTATVTGGAKGDTVEFYDGATKIGTAELDKKGVAAFEWTPDAAGEHTLSAKFLETPHSKGSQSGVQTVQVPVPDAETTTVLTGPSSVQAGVEVSFEAQVSPAPEGGIVQFRDGDTDLGIPVPVIEDGKASITHTFNSGGTHDITAVYSGAPGYSVSTAGAVTVTVTDTDGVPGDGGPGDGDGNTDDGGMGSPGNIFGS
ncbi:hypothetical protein BFN03_00135 [Rhodococcus sp. WMMA185]|nr:hypothetical protein BFN03_00135 [Rhodococcus sp. WMMA185]